MHRRAFLGAGLAWVTASPRLFQDGWRTFEVTTRVDVQSASGLTRGWLPLAHAGSAQYQRVLKQRLTGNAGTLRAIRDDRTGTGILFAEWDAKTAQEAPPHVELTLTVATRDYAVDWSNPTVRGEAPASLRRYLEPARLLPLDGIVRETAQRITRGEADDLGKARAIYEWIVENTARDPAVRGCGTGDIRGMLQTGNLRGKCADLNALFVGLARASGIPARDVYGIRVAPSRSYTSLGKAGDVTASQHCRAEFHSARHGWIPVDPADVRKIVLEEKGGRDLGSPDVQYARRQLFGSWEMNWIAFNDAHDVVLPQAAGPALPFLMYPQAETAGRRVDSLSPEQFRYQITAREV